MPTPVVYAASYLGGIGLQDLATEQGLMHVKYLLGHLRAKSDAEKSSTILIETYNRKKPF
jgi:hypothetical protein